MLRYCPGESLAALVSVIEVASQLALTAQINKRTPPPEQLCRGGRMKIETIGKFLSACRAVLPWVTRA